MYLILIVPGDYLKQHNGQGFYTFDRDSSDKCAEDCHGAWWYSNNACAYSNLNGPWGGPHRSDINVTEVGNVCLEMMTWSNRIYDFIDKVIVVKTSEMKMRRKPLQLTFY